LDLRECAAAWRPHIKKLPENSSGSVPNANLVKNLAEKIVLAPFALLHFQLSPPTPAAGSKSRKKPNGIIAAEGYPRSEFAFAPSQSEQKPETTLRFNFNSLQTILSQCVWWI